MACGRVVAEHSDMQVGIVMSGDAVYFSLTPQLSNCNSIPVADSAEEPFVPANSVKVW
jgi:hypothetical protein